MLKSPQMLVRLGLTTMESPSDTKKDVCRERPKWFLIALQL